MQNLTATWNYRSRIQVDGKLQDLGFVRSDAIGMAALPVIRPLVKGTFPVSVIDAKTGAKRFMNLVIS